MATLPDAGAGGRMSFPVTCGAPAAGLERHSGGGSPPCALCMDSGAIGISIFACMALVNAVLRAGGARPRRAGRRDDDARDRSTGLDRGERRRRPVRTRRPRGARAASEGGGGGGGPGARLAAACGSSSSNHRPRRGLSGGFSGAAGGCLPATVTCGTCRRRRAR